MSRRGTARGPIDRTDLIAGLCVIVMSAAFAYIATGYGIGTVRQMGAGFFPLTLGILGCGLGAAIALRAIFASTPNPASVQWRRLIFVCAAFVVFAIAIQPAGLLLTIVVTTVVGSLADRTNRLRESLVLGLALAAVTWLLFVAGLGLAIPALPGRP